ncbi:HAD family hydrolase [Candidatus Bathyarchaeota archaeon]|nr:HAD family hydrolase [Candidatus Bathyarchaeota archaeon]MCK4482765.1 HAD family hydrolase [Candidatus Bathyarchaeota archaeon]
MIKAVIFDLDGTLIHLPIKYERLFREFNEIMKTTDIRPLAQKISELDGKTKKEIFEVWEKAELAASANATVKDGGIAIYKKFSEKPKALVTLQGKALVQIVLERLDLSFNFVVTREHCLNRVDQLKIAEEKLRASFKNILFVGNTDGDFLAAKKVGCKFLRVKDEGLV